MGRVLSNFDVLSESVPSFSFSAEKLRKRDNKKTLFFRFFDFVAKILQLVAIFCEDVVCTKVVQCN